ncbi:MAG: methyl-accepting chemotaxis protein [Deltaproteobacteria bacterium]|nr:methyl-accepting chemotaxis protein [Deltaproteobacteria bacterium]
MTDLPYKRRNYFIKKNFQGKLILGYFLFMVGGCFLFTIILAALSADTLTVVYRNNDLQLGQTPLMLLKQILTAYWIFIIVGGGVIIVAAMLITHRMAGPIFRLERTLNNMVSGRLDDVICLRKKDEGKEIAAKLNQFNQELSEKIRQVENCSKNIDALLVQYSILDSSTATREDIQSIHASIAGQNQAIQTIAKTFQLLDE